jgi:L-ascorbate metabolism protein UlaG (beta-lactamase superfamily)
MEITWYGGSCVRLKGREGVVAADPYRSIVGPTGRGLTADIVTFSHAEEAPTGGRSSREAGAVSRRLSVPLPTSLEKAFSLDSPGEYEVHGVMITGVRTYRDAERGAERGLSTAFIYELDGLHAAHLGDVGHVLSQETLGEMGQMDIACLAIGPSLGASQAAELVAQLDVSIVVPLPRSGGPGATDADLERFLKEMSVSSLVPVPRLNVTISTLPSETTVVLLEHRGRT